MIGSAGSAGRPFSPWQALQTSALSAIASAQAAVAAERSAATTTLRNMKGNPSRANTARIWRGPRLKVKRKGRYARTAIRSSGPRSAIRLLDCEGDDVVAALGVDLGVAA